MKCEYCNSNNDGNYGSGRFCCQSCARGFASKEKREVINKKVSKKLSKYDKSLFSSENDYKNFVRREYRKEKNKDKPKRVYKRVVADKPYSDFYLYGPIWHKRIGRYMINLVPIDDSKNKRTSMTYAKYLLSVKLGRKLEKWEHADHINNNPLDDRIENVQLLYCRDNNIKSIKHRNIARKMVDFICPICNKQFSKPYNQTFLGRGVKYKNSITVCSRQCSGKLSNMKDKDLLDNIVVKIYRK